SGFARLLSFRSAIRLLTAFLKVAALCLVAWFTARGELPNILQFGDHQPLAALTDFTQLALRLALRVGIVMLLIGAADYAYQLWQHDKDLRMTKMEVQEEAKSAEGDPHIRGRQRSAARKMAKQRMVDAVRGAAVVITNPSHFAVALQYEPTTTPAPRVLAKGRDHLALRIMEEAREHHIPIHRDAPLARALHRDVEVGVQIPPKFYQAVAAILAHVLRQRTRSLGARS
ncbi:MAG: EscU/YscU/HrcU family type III secretion system export apparatus switch protein, partial [Planctomycetota bacterium]